MADSKDTPRLRSFSVPDGYTEKKVGKYLDERGRNRTPAEAVGKQDSGLVLPAQPAAPVQNVVTPQPVVTKPAVTQPAGIDTFAASDITLRNKARDARAANMEAGAAMRNAENAEEYRAAEEAHDKTAAAYREAQDRVKQNRRASELSSDTAPGVTWQADSGDTGNRYNAVSEARYSNLDQNPDYAAMTTVDAKTMEKGRKAPDFSGFFGSKGTNTNLYYNVNHGQEMRDHPEIYTDDDPTVKQAYDFMYDYEVRNFNYLWNTKGEDAARDYYTWLEYQLNSRRTEAINTRMQGFAEEHPVAASVASVGTNLASGAGIVNLAAQNIARAASDEKKPIDYNTGAMLASKLTKTTRETVANKIENNTSWMVGDQNAWSFLYQTGMSMADSAVIAGLSLMGVPGATMLLGGSAATQSALEVKERGGTDAQALAFGIVSGINEALFEEVSLDKLLKPTTRGFAAGLRNVIKQGFTEGSEEVATTLANTIMDAVINGDLSELEYNIGKIIENNPGISREEAAKYAWDSWLKGLAGDFVGGFISGLGMSGVKVVGTTVARVGKNVAGVVSDARTAAQRTAEQTRAENAPRTEEPVARQETEQQETEQQGSAPQPELPTVGTALDNAIEKLKSGQELSGADARRIMQDTTAMQELRDSGVLNDSVRPGAEGRQQVADAVRSYAAMQSEERTAAAQRGSESAELQLTAAEQTRTMAEEGVNKNEAETSRISEERRAEEGRNDEAGAEEGGQDSGGRAERRTAVADTGSVRKVQGDAAKRFVRNFVEERSYRRSAKEASGIRSAAEAAGLQKVSSADMGISGGTDTKNNAVLTRDVMTREMRKRQDEMAKRGVTVNYVIGLMETDGESGSTVLSRGVTSEDGKNIWVTANHPKLTWQQILDHESFHAEKSRDPGIVERTGEALMNDRNVAPKLNEIVRRYTDLYEPLGLSDDLIMEEILADYYAGYDATELLGADKDTAKAVRSEVERQRSPEEAIRMKNGVAADSDVLDGMDGSPQPYDPTSTRKSIETLPSWARFIRDQLGDNEAAERIVEANEKLVERMTQNDFIMRYVPIGLYKHSKYGPLRDNQEYIVTFDMDASCPRTFQFTAYRDELQRAAGRPLTYNESVNLLELMRAYGQMIPCSYCYVENKRVLLSASYNNWFGYRQNVMNAETDAEALRYMYSYNAKKNTVSKAAREVFDEWRSQKGGYNPSAVEVWDAAQTARNSVLNWMDAQKKAGNISENDSETELSDAVSEYFGITKEEARKEIEGYVSEWVYDELAKIDHNYTTENNPDISEVNQDALTLHRLALGYGKSVSQARGVDNYTPYDAQFWNLTDEEIQRINSQGGVRKHSSNDFRMDYVQDYFMFFADLAFRKAFGHTYTKNTDYVRIFGRTGDRINLSIAMEDVDGRVVENKLEGASWKEAKELRQAYKENLGVMAMVTSDAQLSFALNADWIDMIIPFHASGLDKAVWYDLRRWMDYTSKQNERWLTKDKMWQMLKDDGVNLKKSSRAAVISEAFNRHFNIPIIIGEKGKRVKPHFLPGPVTVVSPDGTKTTIPGHENNKEKYLKLCREYGVTPRFAGIMVDNGKGEMIDIIDHPNYMKLVKETARTDTPQKPIEFNFDQMDDYLGMTPFDYAMKRMEEEAKNGGYGNVGEDSLGIMQEFREEYLGKNRPIGYLTERATTYQEEIRAMNNERMQRQAEILGDAIREGQDLEEVSEKLGGSELKHSREMDAAYMAAVEAGDMETAQRVVDEAARAAGYNYERRTTRKLDMRNSLDAVVYMFVERSKADSLGDTYGRNRYFATSENSVSVDDISADLRNVWAEFAEENGYPSELWDSEIDPDDIIDSAGVWDNPEFITYLFDRGFFDQYTDSDIPSVVTSDGLLVFGYDVNRVKSADPVTRDDDGNVIPLSQRFDSENPDIRHSREFSPEAVAPYRGGSDSGEAPRGRKVSRVRSNALEASKFFSDVEAHMDGMRMEDYTYDPVSEKQSIATAKQRIADDFDGWAERLAEDDRQWDGQDVDTAMGILYNYRQEARLSGDYSRVIDFSHVIQRHGTRGGQEIQAFAKYSRTATYQAQKAAEKIIEENALNPAEQKKLDSIMQAVDNIIEENAGEAAEQAMNGLAADANRPDRQKTNDALNLLREIYDIFKLQQENHGEPVEDWVKLTGEELAKRIGGRLHEPKTKAQTTMQTILGDLLKFADEHALPKKKAAGQTRSAFERIADYLNNREAYAKAWATAQQVLRAQYADDPAALDALDAFLTGTISYNGDPLHFDRVMLDAIMLAADGLGIDKETIRDSYAVDSPSKQDAGSTAQDWLDAHPITSGTVDKIARAFTSRLKREGNVEMTSEMEQYIHDTVTRHIRGILTEEGTRQEMRLGSMMGKTAKELNMKFTELLIKSKGDKKLAAAQLTNWLVADLSLRYSDAAIAAKTVTDAFMERLADLSDQRLQRMFAEKETRLSKEKRNKLLELFRLGGFSNRNVEDAVADALGIGNVSREKQREILTAMAQFADTLDDIYNGDAEGIKALIRRQAALRKTKLSGLAEKALEREHDFDYLYDFAMAQLKLIAADYQKRDFGSKASTVQTISHLLNPRTAMRNVIANQVFDLVASAANNVSLIPDMIIGKVATGKRTVGLNRSWTSSAKRQGAIRGASRNLLEVALDVDPRGDDASKYGTKGRDTFSAATARGYEKFLNLEERILGYELNTTDEFHKGSVRGETLESLARHVDSGDITIEEAREIAEMEALSRSFQDDTMIGAVMHGMKEVLNLLPGFGDSGKRIHGLKVHNFAPGDFLLKYTQVPGALIHRAIEFSPTGYLKAAYHIGQIAVAKKHGESTTIAQRKAAIAVGQATTGSGLILLAMVLAKAGLLRKDDDEKDKNAKAMKSAQGLSGAQLNLSALGRALSGKPVTLEDGDVLADISYLEPLDTLFTTATLLAKEDKLWGNITSDSLTGIWDALRNTTAMQSINSIYNVIQYHDEENDLPLYYQIPFEIASDSVTGFVPAPVRQIAQATDTIYRDQYRSQSLLDQTAAKLANTIPGVRQSLAPKLTPLGEEKRYQKPLLNALNATTNPGNISVYKTNKVIDELNSVYDATGDAKIWPERNAPYSTTISKQKITLTTDERTQYQQTRGQLTYQMADACIGTEWYKKLSAEDKADCINWIGNFANYIAKSDLAQSRGMDYISNTYKKYAEALRSGRSLADIVKMYAKS